VKAIPTVRHRLKWREVLLESEAGRSDIATVSNILMAEFRHFHEMLVSDLKTIVETFIQQQVAYHTQMASMWQGLLPSFAA
jgi:protein-arginine kinase